MTEQPKIVVDVQSYGCSRDTFAQVVGKYRQQREDHSKMVGVPAPVPSWPIVADLISRTVEADPNHGERNIEVFRIKPYEFAPDPVKPSEDQAAAASLAQKKQGLLQKVHEMARVAHEANMPPGQSRIWNIQFMRALRNREREPDKLSDEDKQTIDSMEKRRHISEEIELHLGKLETAVYALTEKSVDMWTPEAFPS